MKWLLEKPHAALFLDPGLGKTSITLAAYKILKKKHYTDGMLVVAPLRVAHSVWPAEVQEWDDFKDLSVVVLHGKDKARWKEKHDIYAINYDGLAWLVQSGVLDKMLQARQIDWVVWDELSKMKTPSTKRFKLMKKFLHRFKRRTGLTGSPAANGLMDLFGQMYVLDRGARLGEYITHYRSRYFVPAGPYDWKVTSEGERQIKENIKDIAMYMSADDYLDLPKLVNHTVMVDLPPKARQIYDDMEDELFALLDNGERLTAATAAAAHGKCKQIANGAVYRDMVDPVTGMPLAGPRDFEEIHDAKIEALLDLIDELQGQQIFVAYEFQHDLYRLLAALPKGTPFIGGGTKESDAAEIERRWNEGRLSVLLGHPASIGHGLNLQKSDAHHVCWFSPTWNYELYDQFNRRIRRQGNKTERVTVHHIVARDTVDLAAMATLRNKATTQNALLAALQTYRKGLPSHRRSR